VLNKSAYTLVHCTETVQWIPLWQRSYPSVTNTFAHIINLTPPILG